MDTFYSKLVVVVHTAMRLFSRCTLWKSPLFSPWVLGQYESHVLVVRVRTMRSCIIWHGAYWVTLTHRLKWIFQSLSMHTRFSCDFCFWCGRRKFWRTRISLLDDIAEVCEFLCIDQQPIFCVAHPLCWNHKCTHPYYYGGILVTLVQNY